MPKTILFNADDWGLSQQTHKSVVLLNECKAIDAAGIMMGQQFTDTAVSYAKQNPSLRVGLHLFGSDRDCNPLTRSSWPSLWPKNSLINTAIGLPSVSRVVLAEVEAQLGAWRKTGLPLRFLNSHFHFHAHHLIVDQVTDQLLKYFPDFDGWIRLGDSRFMRGGLIGDVDPLIDIIESNIFARKWQGWSNDTSFGIDRSFSNSADEIVKVCSGLNDGLHEFSFHPGRSWKLGENGDDHSALLELATRLPQSTRNINLLLPPHNPAALTRDSS